MALARCDPVCITPRVFQENRMFFTYLCIYSRSDSTWRTWLNFSFLNAEAQASRGHDA